MANENEEKQVATAIYSKEDIIRRRTENYIKTAIQMGNRPEPENIEVELISDFRTCIDMTNKIIPKGDTKLKPIDRLSPAVIADVEAALYPGRLRKINLSGEKNGSQCVIGLYQESGDDKGIDGQAKAQEEAVEEKEQDQNGNAAEKPDVQGYKAAQQGWTVDLCHGKGHTKAQSHGQGCAHSTHGDKGAAQDVGQGIEDD